MPQFASLAPVRRCRRCATLTPAAGLQVRLPPASGQIGDGEAAYITKRKATAAPAWSDYFVRLGFNNTVAAALTSDPSKLPTTAIAVSGGGLRAMLYGGSMLDAFDSRTASSNAAKTGGIQQIATYLTGLSGGSWMTGSWALASAPTFRQLNADVWRLNTPLGAPTPDKPFSAVSDGVISVGEKGSSNFPVSFVDVYGRSQAPHLLCVVARQRAHADRPATTRTRVRASRRYGRRSA